jgi:hypothetical protein
VASGDRRSRWRARLRSPDPPLPRVFARSVEELPAEYGASQSFDEDGAFPLPEEGGAFRLPVEDGAFDGLSWDGAEAAAASSPRPPSGETAVEKALAPARSAAVVSPLLKAITADPVPAPQSWHSAGRR